MSASSSAAPRGPVTRKIPEGDERDRLVCEDCGYIAYENPKIVIGSVVRHDGRYLLCRRAMLPRWLSLRPRRAVPSLR